MNPPTNILTILTDGLYGIILSELFFEKSVYQN